MKYARFYLRWRVSHIFQIISESFSLFHRLNALRADVHLMWKPARYLTGWHILFTALSNILVILWQKWVKVCMFLSTRVYSRSSNKKLLRVNLSCNPDGFITDFYMFQLLKITNLIAISTRSTTSGRPKFKLWLSWLYDVPKVPAAWSRCKLLYFVSDKVILTLNNEWENGLLGGTKLEAQPLPISCPWHWGISLHHIL